MQVIEARAGLTPGRFAGTPTPILHGRGVGMPTLLVTGGCGFIGSNFVRHLLAHRPGRLRRQLRRPHLRRQPRQPRGRRDAPALPVRQGRHHRPRRGPRRHAARRHRRHPLRGREPRRSQHPGLRAVRPHQRHRHAGAARRRPRVRASTKYVQVSTDEVYGSLGPTGLFTEDDAAGPEQPVLGEQGRRPTCSCRRTTTRSACRRVITRCSNNYGPYQFPEKLIPLFVTNLLRRRAGAGLRRRACRSATGFTSSTTAAASRRRGGTGKPGEVYNFGGRCEKTNLELTHTAARPARQAADADPLRRRTAPATTAATRSTARRPSASWAGRRRCRSSAGCARRSTGTRRTRRGSPAIRNKDYLSYYEKQYGKVG